MKKLLFVVATGLAVAIFIGARGTYAQAPDETTFELVSNPKFLNCLAADPNNPPEAEVHVERGELNDKLVLELEGVKPNLAFDLFTIENSNLLSDGTVDPNFKNFGLAWYQSDIQADDNGDAKVKIRTILLDQIFGFDPAVGLGPTNTFHLGFWFNDPNDAADCGFDVTKPTPFNGEHKAGPNAMISVPDPDTGLGPLCINPDATATPPKCNP